MLPPAEQGECITCQEASKSGDGRVVEGDGGRQLSAEALAKAVAQLHSTCIINRTVCCSALSPMLVRTRNSHLHAR
jgi:hypothetical protein